MIQGYFAATNPPRKQILRDVMICRRSGEAATRTHSTAFGGGVHRGGHALVLTLTFYAALPSLELRGHSMFWPHARRCSDAGCVTSLFSGDCAG